jgi:predicted Zn-dependent peptidase
MADITDAFETIQKSDNFTEFKLKSNGLRLVVIPHPSVTNSLSCTMVYHVGSYDERVGYTGSTHLLVSHPIHF